MSSGALPFLQKNTSHNLKFKAIVSWLPSLFASAFGLLMVLIGGSNNSNASLSNPSLPERMPKNISKPIPTQKEKYKGDKRLLWTGTPEKFDFVKNLVTKKNIQGYASTVISLLLFVQAKNIRVVSLSHEELILEDGEFSTTSESRDLSSLSHTPAVMASDSRRFTASKEMSQTPLFHISTAQSKDKNAISGDEREKVSHRQSSQELIKGNKYEIYPRDQKGFGPTSKKDSTTSRIYQFCKTTASAGRRLLGLALSNASAIVPRCVSLCFLNTASWNRESRRRLSKTRKSIYYTRFIDNSHIPSTKIIPKSYLSSTAVRKKRNSSSEVAESNTKFPPLAAIIRKRNPPTFARIYSSECAFPTKLTDSKAFNAMESTQFLEGKLSLRNCTAPVQEPCLHLSTPKDKTDCASELESPMQKEPSDGRENTQSSPL